MKKFKNYLRFILMTLILTFSLLGADVYVVNAYSDSDAVSRASVIIKLNKTSATLYLGTKLKLKATVSGSSSKVKWITGNAKIATVKNGVVTPKKVGKVAIKAKVNGKTAKCTITVKKDSATYKTINRKTPTIKFGNKTFSTGSSSGGTGYCPIFVTEGTRKKCLIPENDGNTVVCNGIFLYYGTKYSGSGETAIYRIYRYDLNTGEKTYVASGKRISPIYCDGTYLYYGDLTQYGGVIETLRIMNLITGKTVTSPIPFADDIRPVKNKLLVSGVGRPHGSPMYLMNKDGTNAKKITEEYVNEVKISGNYIYFTEITMSWKSRSCRCDLDGKNVKYLTGWVGGWDVY